MELSLFKSDVGVYSSSQSLQLFGFALVSELPKHSDAVVMQLGANVNPKLMKWETGLETLFLVEGKTVLVPDNAAMDANGWQDVKLFAGNLHCENCFYTSTNKTL